MQTFSFNRFQIAEPTSNVSGDLVQIIVSDISVDLRRCVDLPLIIFYVHHLMGVMGNGGVNGGSGSGVDSVGGGKCITKQYNE